MATLICLLVLGGGDAARRGAGDEFRIARCFGVCGLDLAVA